MRPDMTPPRVGHPLRIGLVSTRLGTTDGVSLEADKWSEVLARLGNACFFFAGECDQPPDRSHVVPEAHFRHAAILDIYHQAFTKRERPRRLTDQIRELAAHLKKALYEFASRFEIELLLVENALAIPLNIPLGVALTEFIAETGIPTIAHHHDMHWERKRFLVNCVQDYLDMCFPPRLPQIWHVVINSPASAQLSYRRGIPALLVPNVMDFDRPPPVSDGYASTLRADLQLGPADRFLLQPTRVVQRKGIEHSIELVRRMDIPAKLVISHASGDEGEDYEQYLRQFSQLLNTHILFVSDIISDHRGFTSDGRKVYALSDVYPLADMVTYPSELEGFGNAFLEAIYHRKPVLVNEYSIYAVDIKPKGFWAIEMSGFVSDATVAAAEHVLQSPSLAAEMAEHNYQLGRRFYSFAVLEHQLLGLLQSITGEDRRD